VPARNDIYVMWFELTDEELREGKPKDGRKAVFELV
jgi:hypothetical protein